MRQLNKTKIDSADMSWNPITGCLHGCNYCYARSIATRFGGHSKKLDDTIADLFDEPHQNVYVEDSPCRENGRIIAYPHQFQPTFHRYRLNEPSGITKSSNIFVGSMTDLFGKWVPEQWIKQVFDACQVAPQHRYLFLTKNPDNLPMSSYIYNNRFNKHDNNFWLGASVSTQSDLERVYKKMTNINGNTFLSIEPLHGLIDLSRIDTGDVIYNGVTNIGYYLGGGQKVNGVKWVIIGAETGNRKGKIVPKREWVQNIIEQCHTASVPVFMKNSLANIWGSKLIQEFPWEVQP